MPSTFFTTGPIENTGINRSVDSRNVIMNNNNFPVNARVRIYSLNSTKELEFNSGSITIAPFSTVQIPSTAVNSTFEYEVLFSANATNVLFSHWGIAYLTGEANPASTIHSDLTQLRSSATALNCY